MRVELPSLVWVLVDGVPRHVSDFAGLPRGSRPVARCPHCGEPVTLKLGEVRRHHAAHDPGAVCAATHPETALHINCKLALAVQLRQAAGTGKALSIIRRCDEAGCVETQVSNWLSAWNEVRVEVRVGDTRRPDITLFLDERPVGAIEIVVSNRVSPEKARELDALGVPWIEVLGSEHLAKEGTPEEPLLVARSSECEVWRCAVHEQQYAAACEARRHRARLVAARVVDLYHAAGARDRFIYRVSELLTDDMPHAMRLSRGTVEVLTTPVTSTEQRRAEAWPIVRQAMHDDLVRFMRDAESFTDSPMRWATSDAAANIVEEALLDRVGRDPTPLATRYPRRWFFSPESGTWFLAPDMRDVRWDRDPHDVFAEHPAWSQRQSVVRERPAPEGSWSTPVFASRPIAALFRNQARRITRVANDAIGIVELETTSPDRDAVIVVIERRAADEEVLAVANELATRSIDALWISHPSDWTEALASLAWVPGGRDWHGHGGVVIDSLGVFRVDQIVRVWRKQGGALSPDTIRERMAGRVARLRGDVSGQATKSER